MSATDFLDTNILIYAVCPDDHRSAPAREVISGGGTVSVQVLNEFASVAQRKLKRGWPEIRAALNDFRAVLSPVKPLTARTHEAALHIAATGSFAFYDALIIAAALEARCTTLLSEDMQDGGVVEGLAIRNPFRPAAQTR